MSQKSVVVGLLREAGPKGVSVHDLVYRYGITRAATIIYDLRQQPPVGPGMTIDTLDEGNEKLARYVLRAEIGREFRSGHAVDTQPKVEIGEPVEFWCGCVRTADGKTWIKRCEADSSKPVEPGQMVTW